MSIVCITFLFTGCGDDRIVGGPEGPIYGRYPFANYEEFKAFYEIFIDYNEERYFVPETAENGLLFKYEFTSAGVKLNLYKEKRYNLDFPNPQMFVEITSVTDEDFYFKGDWMDVKDVNLSETFTYQITENYRKKTCLNIYSNEDIIFAGEFTETLSTEDINAFAEKLLQSFNKRALCLKDLCAQV